MKAGHNISTGACYDRKEITNGCVKVFVSSGFNNTSETLQLQTLDAERLHEYETIVRGGEGGMGTVTGEILYWFRKALDSKALNFADIEPKLSSVFMGVGLIANPHRKDHGYSGIPIKGVLRNENIDELTSQGAIWLPAEHSEAEDVTNVLGRLRPEDDELADKLLADIRKRIARICGVVWG